MVREDNKLEADEKLDKLLNEIVEDIDDETLQTMAALISKVSNDKIGAFIGRRLGDKVLGRVLDTCF